MKKILLTLTTLPLLLSANFQSSISTITPQIKQRMVQGNSYRSGCPIALNNLRYLQLSYIGFDNKEHLGELIVHKDIASDIIAIFKKLYKIRYPIRKMSLVSNYKGNDFASIEADNTSAFNCRQVGNSNRWSKHSFGKAIDINPIENPYVTLAGHFYHKKSKKFVHRVRVKNTTEYKAMILKNDQIVQVFKNHGWRWGGEFFSYKDYQHFDKKK
jgi:hypothetical protein